MPGICAEAARIGQFLCIFFFFKKKQLSELREARSSWEAEAPAPFWQRNALGMSAGLRWWDQEQI